VYRTSTIGSFAIHLGLIEESSRSLYMLPKDMIGEDGFE